MVTDDLVQQTGLTKEALVEALNILISERKVQLYNYNDSRGVAYRLEDPTLSAKYGGTCQTQAHTRGYMCQV